MSFSSSSCSSSSVFASAPFSFPTATVTATSTAITTATRSGTRPIKRRRCSSREEDDKEEEYDHDDHDTQENDDDKDDFDNEDNNDYDDEDNDDYDAEDNNDYDDEDDHEYNDDQAENGNVIDSTDQTICFVAIDAQNDESEKEGRDGGKKEQEERLSFDGKFLTSEQASILRHHATPGEKIIINAFGGAGKTTTLRALVRHKSRELPPDEPRKSLYIVFGEKMAADARKAFLSNSAGEMSMEDLVDVRTYHSLTLLYLKESLERRGIIIPPNAPFEFQTDGYKFGLLESAHQSLFATLGRFTRDPSTQYTEPQPHHTRDARSIPQNVTVTEQMLDDRERRDLAGARAIWHDVINARRQGDRFNRATGRMEHYYECSHDITLKWFCLNAAESERFVSERYHTVLMDEAQDTQLPLLHWLLYQVQELPVYLVGDTYQSIFAFTGALDAIEIASEHPRAVKFFLTESFRFGSDIARVCTALLRSASLLPPHLSIKGNDARRGRGTVHALDRAAIPQVAPELVRSVIARTGCRDIAVLARNNHAALTAAVALFKKGYFVRLAGPLADQVEGVLDVLKKYRSDEHVFQRFSELTRKMVAIEKRQQVWHQRISEGAVLAPPSAQSGYDAEGFVRGWMRLTESERFEYTVLEKTFGRFREMYRIYDGLHKCTKMKSPPSDCNGDPGVEITVCTVHTAKGGEWDVVIMLDDFAELEMCVKARIGTMTREDFTNLQSARYGVHFGNHTNTHQMLQHFFATHDETPLRQEMHLYYVGLTRAKQHLFVNAATALVVNAIDPLETIPLSDEALRIVRREKPQLLDLVPNLQSD